MRKSHFASLAAALLAPIVAASASNAEIVYNNSPNPATWTSFQTVEQNWEIGDDVTLAGTARNVDQFQVYITNQFTTPADPTVSQGYTGTFTATFYTIGTDGLPASQLWQGTAQVQTANGDPTDRWVSFSVPNVLVPDSFIWSIQAATDLPAPSSDPNATDGLGVVLNAPPTVGSSQDLAYANLHDGLGWYQFNYQTSTPPNDEASFGAKIDAVPEPASLGLMAFGGLALLARRRRAIA